MAAAAQLKVEPVLARPWVLLRNAMDTTHMPSWLQRDHLQFTEKLFSKGIHATPVLVAQTLYKMKGQTPHVAFVGRSNVGKSTLLNMLLHRRPSPVPEHWSNSRKLRLPTAAPVSHTPGRTRHLFRFELGGALTLVDLPGYGHAAKTPKEVKESWRDLIDGYLTNADHLRLVVSLVDGRVGVKRSDEELWELLEERERQLMVVLTKVDQCSPEVLNRTMAHVVSLLEMKKATFVWPYVHAVSGLHGHGVDELRASVSLVASDYVARKQSKKRKLLPHLLSQPDPAIGFDDATDGARVIAVSSTAHLGANKELMTGDLMAPERYTTWGAYCQSKLANVLFAKELDRKFKKAGINATAVSCHPGGVDTDLARWTMTADGDPQKAMRLRKDSPAADAFFSFVTRSVKLGANTQVFLAAGGDGGYNKSGGEYFDNMAPGSNCRSLAQPCTGFALMQTFRAMAENAQEQPELQNLQSEENEAAEAPAEAPDEAPAEDPAEAPAASAQSELSELQTPQAPSSQVQVRPPPLKRAPAPPRSLRNQKNKARKAKDEPRPVWDDRHHLNFNDDNSEKPKRLRSYFSRPQSLPELRADVEKRPNAKSILKKLETDEGTECPKCTNVFLMDSLYCRRCGTKREQMPAQAASFVSADAGPAVCPLRHAAGGDMADRDGARCPWNNRWQAGVHILNEQMHPLHRSSFATKSLFETAPSQRWRRHLDVQNEFGSWRSMLTSKGEKFPPLGV
ncbi:engB [Symbiodinium natans]|uniref:EngB protein n=1 Tax=Symbiodinium natans TaxID=878477 RepID=A0A812T8Q0_9DINO|nr:engB [Symbiodinium natans]